MLLKWGLAAVFVLHGIGHAMFAFAIWTEDSMGFTDLPWILPEAVTADSFIGQVSAVIWLVALLLFLAAAFGLVRGANWWPVTVLTGAVLSLIVLVIWWNTITPESRVWVAFVDVVIIAALAGPWKASVLEIL